MHSIQLVFMLNIFWLAQQQQQWELEQASKVKVSFFHEAINYQRNHLENIFLERYFCEQTNCSESFHHSSNSSSASKQASSDNNNNNKDTRFLSLRTCTRRILSFHSSTPFLHNL